MSVLEKSKKTSPAGEEEGPHEFQPSREAGSR